MIMKNATHQEAAKWSSAAQAMNATGKYQRARAKGTYVSDINGTKESWAVGKTDSTKDKKSLLSLSFNHLNFHGINFNIGTNYVMENSSASCQTKQVMQRKLDKPHAQGNA